MNIFLLQLSKQINVDSTNKKSKKQKKRNSNAKTKVDAEMQLEGNLQLNQIKKKQFKKERKMKNRKEIAEKQLTNGLNNFTIAGESTSNDNENYSFETDYVI